MEILLHLGAHRTATTTLQHMLGQSHVGLQGAGLGYWGPKRLRAGLFDGLYSANDTPLLGKSGRAQKRVRLQARKAADHGTALLFVSEENMLGTMRRLLTQTRLYDGAGARVARFAAGFEGHGVTLGVSIRCYDAFWTSVIGWRLRHGGMPPDGALCERLITQPRRWRHVIADLAQAMPGIAIRVWTHEAMAGRPDQLITQLTGVRLAMRGQDAWCNPTPHAARLITECRDRGLLEGAAVLPLRAGRFMPFSTHQRAILRAQYQEDLDWLAAGAGGLATYIDTAGAKTQRLTGQGRGRPDDQDDGCLAQAG